ncbi:MAG: hypothetical protein WKF37_22400 [Bryobacteraceae bacterium]
MLTAISWRLQPWPVDKSIANKAAGLVLPRAQQFTNLLPRDRHTNFSAMFYQNAGPALRLVAQAMGNEQQVAAGEVAAKMGPTLISAYGDRDRIEIASNGSPLNLLLQGMIGGVFSQGTHPAQPSYQK